MARINLILGNKATCKTKKQYNLRDRADVLTKETKSTIENRKIGGLGLHFVKNMMDNISYDYVNNKNCLTLKKKIREI